MATFSNQNKTASTLFSNQNKTASTLFSNQNKTTVHNHLLTELGYFLCQENGDHILLESSGAGAITWDNLIKN